jgi:hypothetical protein
MQKSIYECYAEIRPQFPRHKAIQFAIFSMKSGHYLGARRDERPRSPLGRVGGYRTPEPTPAQCHKQDTTAPESQPTGQSMTQNHRSNHPAAQKSKEGHFFGFSAPLRLDSGEIKSYVNSQ